MSRMSGSILGLPETDIAVQCSGRLGVCLWLIIQTVSVLSLVNHLAIYHLLQLPVNFIRLLNTQLPPYCHSKEFALRVTIN